MNLNPRALIVDVDGTLADNSHRKHFVEGVEKKDWKAFFAGAPFDLPKRHVGSAAKHICIEFDYTPIILTERSLEHWQVTRDWIDKHFPFLRCANLYCRPIDDFRSDTIVKCEIYEKAIAPHYDVRLAIDDRDCIVNLWRSLGIETWQVAEGNF